MQMKNGRTSAVRALILGVVTATSIGGCTSEHGNYTQEGKDLAQQRIASLKAATDWDMANQQYQAGDLKKALKNVEDSIELDDAVAKSHVLHGRILIEMDRLETSLKAFEKALEVDPKCADAEYYQGIIYERFVRFDQAYDHYEKAADLDEANPQYRIAAAEMLIQLDRVEDAKKELETGQNNFEHNAGFRQTLGHIAMMQGDHEKAVELFNEACILAPADQGLMEDLARAQVEAKKYADAEYTLRKLVEMDTGNDRRDLKYLRALCLIEVDKPVEARTILLQLTGDARGSGDIQSWVELGRVSLVLGEDYRLRQCAQRVIAMAPHRSEGYMMMATAQHRAGKTSEAIQTLSKAIPVSDDPESLVVMQGVLYYEMGNETKARAAAQLAMKANPTDPRAQALMSRVDRGSAAVANVTDSTE